MKVLLLVTFAAAVCGEADPYLLYGNGYGYAGYGGLIPTTSGGLVPAGGPLVPGYAAYGAYAGAYGAYPYAYAGAPVAVGGPCKNNDGAAVPCAAPTVYGHWAGYPYLFAAAPSAESTDAGVEEARKKREAEPEADPYYFYGHGGYAGYGGLIPTTSGGLVPSGGPVVPGYAAYAAWPYGYAHYGYHHGCRNNAGALVPCA